MSRNNIRRVENSPLQHNDQAPNLLNPNHTMSQVSFLQQSHSLTDNSHNTPEEGWDNDPAQALSRLKQAEQNWKITNQVLTPFDTQKMVQTLNVPKRPGEVITVKMVTENVSQFESYCEPEPDTEDPRFMKCNKCHSQLVPSQIVDNPVAGKLVTPLYCDIKNCSRKTKQIDTKCDASYFYCLVHNRSKKGVRSEDVFECCAQCYTDYFVRKSLQTKTDKHAYFEPFHFDMTAQKFVEKHGQSLLEDTMSGIRNNIEYGKAQKTKLPPHERSSMAKKTYALVGLWTQVIDDTQSEDDLLSEDEYKNRTQRCYRQFMIDDPVAINRGGPLELQEFLFFSDDHKQLFYFNREEDQICFSLVDLQDLTDSSPIQAKKSYDADVFGMPVHYSSPIPSSLQQIFGNFFKGKNQPQPRLVGGDLICLRSQEGPKTSFLKFINYMEWEVDFSINDANLLLKVIPAKKKGSKHFFESVWFISKNKVKQIGYNLPGPELRCYTIEQKKVDEFDHYFKENQVTAIMHYSDTRVTINVHNENCFSYQIDQAGGGKIYQWILFNQKLSDASIIQDLEQDSVYLVNCLQPYEFKGDAVEDHYTLNLYDLNRDSDQCILENLLTSSVIQTLHLGMKDSVVQHQNDIKIMPFSVENGSVYRSQLIYVDRLTGQNNVLFFIAEKADVSDNEIQETESPWMLLQQQHQMQYPILVHTTAHFNRNYLMLANVAKNKPLMKIHLEATFICFVEAEKSDNSLTANECSIYFLATDYSNQVGLYELRTEPWKSATDDYVHLSKVPWNIDLGVDYGIDQIKKVQMLTVGEQKRIILLVQLTQSIVVLRSDQPMYPLFKQDDNVKMAPILLMRGLCNLCYFVLQKPEGDVMTCVKYDENNSCLDLIPIKAVKLKILQIQINMEAVPNKLDKHKFDLNQIFVLDSSMTLTLLVCKNNLMYQNELSVAMVAHKVWNMTGLGLKRVFRAIELVPWTTCVLTELALICARTAYRADAKETQEGVKLDRKSCIYSTEFQQFKEQSFLHPYCESSRGQSKSIYIDIEPIHSVGKILSMIKEQTFGYYLTSSTFTKRRIDLMSYFQLKELNYNYYVMKTVILLASEDTYLVFDQKFQLLQAVEQGNVKLVDDNNKLIEIQLSKKPIVKKVCKYDRKGVRVELYDRNQIAIINNKEAYAKPHTEQILKQFEGFKVEFTSKTFFKSKPFIVVRLEPKENEKEIDKNDLTKARIWEFIDKMTIIAIITEKYEIFYIQNTIGKKLFALMRVAVTQDFIVINLEDQVLFARRSDIKTFNESETQLSYYDLPLKRIPLTDMFENKTYENGLRLVPVSKRDMNILSIAKRLAYKGSKAEEKLLKSGEKILDYQTVNGIQISMENTAVIWDLDNDHEISTMYNIQDFAKYNSFVRSGFRYHAPPPSTSMRDTKTAWLQRNEDCTLVSLESSKENISFCFRLYSALELYWMIQIEETLEAGVRQVQSTELCPSLYTTNVHGNTFFSLMYKWSDLLDLVIKQISEMDLPKLDEQDDIFIRKLFYTIKLPYVEHTSHIVSCQSSSNDQKTKEELWKLKYLPDRLTKKGRRDLGKVVPSLPLMSILYQRHIFVKTRDTKQIKRVQKDRNLNHHTLTQYLIANDDPTFEKLIKLQLMSSELSLRTLISQFSDFKNVFRVQSEMINEFMAKAFIQTSMTRRVEKIRWNQDQSIVVFAAKTAQLEEGKIYREIKQTIWESRTYIDKLKQIYYYNQKNRFRSVEVRVIEVGWLNDNIGEFYKFLAQQPPDLLENDLIKVLLAQMTTYTWQIVTVAFGPFMVYMVACLYYFIVEIPKDYTVTQFDPAAGDHWDAILCRVFIIPLTIYLLGIEVQQMYFLKGQYFLDLWNYGNICSILLNLLIVVFHSTGSYENSSRRLVQVASFASVLLWYNLFNWMRLFSETAFYVKLLGSTIYDIGIFLFFFMMILLTFTNGTYILETHFKYTHADDYKDYEPLITGDLGFGEIETSLVSQYLLGLAEFDQFSFESFESNESTEIVWTYFVVATFLTNIVFLNMLIAIMGDTFTRIIENKERNSLVQQTRIFSDFISILNKNKQKVNTSKYIYVATPVVNDGYLAGDGATWEGGFNKILFSLDRLGGTCKLNLDKTGQANHKELLNVKKVVDGIMESSKVIRHGIDQIAFRADQVIQKSNLKSQKTFLMKKTKMGIFNLTGASMPLNTPQATKSPLGSGSPYSQTQPLQIRDFTVGGPQLQPQSPTATMDFNLVQQLMAEMSSKISSQINPKLKQMQAQITKHQMTVDVMERDFKLSQKKHVSNNGMQAVLTKTQIQKPTRNETTHKTLDETELVMAERVRPVLEEVISSATLLISERANQSEDYQFTN